MSTEWVRPVVKPSNPWPFLALVCLIVAGCIAWRATEPPIVPIVLPAPFGSTLPAPTQTSPTETPMPLLVIIASNTPTIPPTLTVTNTPPIYCRKGLATNTPCQMPIKQPVRMTSTPLPFCSTETPGGEWCSWKDQQ